MTTQVQADPEERAVEEVHCIECGVPISSIPAWYADVHVKFTCDNCRQKSPRLAAPLPALEIDQPRAVVPALADADPDVEAGIDDVDVDEIEIDDADIEVPEE